MLVQKDFLNKLRDFGLNTYEAKLWTALLSKGLSNAGELSDIANVPRSRSYDVLESLEKKGFVMMKIGKPIKYLAIPPEEVLERVKKKIQENFEEDTSIIEELKSNKIFEELTKLHTKGSELIEPNELMGAIKGRNNIYNLMETMIKNSAESVFLMTTKEGFIKKQEKLKKSFEKASNNKVDIRIISNFPKENINGNFFFSKIAKLKNIKEPARFCIVDGKELIFMLNDNQIVHSDYDVAVWVKSPYFVSAFKKLFVNAWETLK